MRKILLPALFCLAFLLGCGSYSASKSARSYVSSKTTWEYESTAVGGQAILKLSDGPKLTVPANHNFIKKFAELTKGGFVYCDNCGSDSDEVATYLAPNDEDTKKVLSARGSVGPGQ